jgi:K+-sensing histidine kinase KdpD
MDGEDTPTVARELPKRGCHKIFLGYAAGVGKTYTMLSEAQRRASRGEDLVIGFVEPHKRPETQALTEGLERVPAKRIDYRGTTSSRTPTCRGRSTRSAGSRWRRSLTRGSTSSPR